MGRLMRGHAIAATLWLALLLLASALPAVAGSDIVFDRPRASGVFGETVTFSTTFRSEQPPRRVELLTQVPGGEGQGVEFASVERTGDDTWEATAYRSGHIVPNTRWDYRFRVITDDGSVVGPVATHRYADERLEWQVLEGDRVNVWWHEGGDSFGRQALAIAEEALASASELLGVGEMEPIDFYIYSDTREFRQAMGPATRENVGGQAHPSIRTLFGLIEPRQIGSDWIEELITHELVHLVFHEAVDNPYQYPPRWLNEGLAVYVSRGYVEGDRLQVHGAAAGGTIIPLEGLGGNFPTRATRSGLAYAESVSAVDFFVKTYGQEQLVRLITSFADGTGLVEAFVAATGDDLAAFDEAWLESLGAEPPEPYGPREGEPGPVPDAWAA
ncbi:MAG: hypothetical protein DRQ55_19045 [Planctomycetota bacterium]|nr:MAG: hypothetical protein DRQ55_19045 [Planctomycetota bacterium]